MTIDSTVAKIGRSMKKCEIIGLAAPHLGAVAGLSALGGRRLRRLPACAARRRRLVPALAERRHRHPLRLDLHARPDLLQAADDDPVVRLQPLGDHPQAVVLQRPRS